MFDEKKPPKTWPICDIVTGTIKSALGHVLHAMLLNKTNLPENNRVRTHPGKPGIYWNLIIGIPGLEYTGISSKVLENTGI